MNENQREMARHALGLNKSKRSFRNHYCVEKCDPDYAEWENLVAKGLASKSSGGANWIGDFFFLTKEGAREVLLPGEKLKED